MSGEGLTEVGQLIAISNAKGGTPTPEPIKVEPPKPLPPTPRAIAWTLKDPWEVGENFDLAALGVTLSAGPANAALTAPAAGKLTKGGPLTVTVTAAAKDGFAEAVRTAAVTVNKLQPTIAWRTPLPVTRGATLSDNELDAAITPTGLKLVYAPAKATAMNDVGEKTLAVSFAGDDGHKVADAKVTLTVAASDTARASALGSIGMLSGRAHGVPLEQEAQDALDNWHKSDPTDPTSMKGQAREIMANIHGKTPKELLTYMDGLVTDPADRWLNDLNDKGNPRLYPNIIWKMPNGLQVRYKPNGDGQDGLTEPMFCIEGRRTDIPGFSTEPKESAFKVMPNGEAAPWGPRDTVLPSLGDTVLDAKAMKAACGTTHLFCLPMQDQVITWAGPGTLDVGTELTTGHLNATALGGVVPTYVEGTAAVVAGQKLAGGAHTITAVTAETDRYKAGRRDAVITIKRKAQVVTYTGPTALFANSTLDEDDVTVLGNAPISFELDGNEVEADEPLARGDGLDLIVRAAETAEYEAGEVSVTVSVTKAQWVIEWADPPDIIAGEKLTSAHLNATAEGAGLFMEYEDEDGNKLKVGSVLDFIEREGEDEDHSASQTQDLTVTAKTSATFASTSKTVTITVLPKPKAKAQPPKKKGK